MLSGGNHRQYDPPLCIYQKELKADIKKKQLHIDIHTIHYSPSFSSDHEWINKMSCIYVMEYYSLIK